MTEQHEMRLSDLDFGDDLLIIVCDICGRSLSFDSDKKGIWVPESMKIINEGDYDAGHTFYIGPIGFALSVSTEAG